MCNDEKAKFKKEIWNILITTTNTRTYKGLVYFQKFQNN